MYIKETRIIINRHETGKKISEAILSRGFSDEEFATLIGVAELASVQRWRKGKTIPSTASLLAMKEVLDVNVEDLIDYIYLM